MLPLAKIDLSEIIDYLSEYSLNTALGQYDRIVERIKTLSQFPLSCEEFAVAEIRFKYRRLVVDNYLVFYVVYDDYIEIHRIVHSKRNIDKIF